jgi:hypothetical protein
MKTHGHKEIFLLRRGDLQVPHGSLGADAVVEGLGKLRLVVAAPAKGRIEK